MKKVSLAYGKGSIGISVPDSADIAEPKMPPALSEIDPAIGDALADPIGSRALSDLLRERKPKRVAITISDITRAVPNKIFLPRILGVIDTSGISPDDVTIIVGTGMHRPSSSDELLELVGEQIMERYQVIDHHADREDELVTISTDPYVSINRFFMEADFRIVTGFIEPHFMAGFSGGRKGVCPALVNLKTIERFHGYPTLANPASREGVLEGNPCHEIALEVARKAGVDFLFNVTINAEKEITGIFCGDLEGAHSAGTSFVADSVGVKINHPYDLVITSGGGYPLDTTFYQSVKGMCLAMPALGENSRLAIASDCSQQFGSPAYTDLMKQYHRDWRQFINDASTHPEKVLLDQWELQMQCRVLERIGQEHLHFFSDGMEMENQGMAIVDVPDLPGSVEERLQKFVDRWVGEHPGASMLVVPEGPYVMLGK